MKEKEEKETEKKKTEKKIGKPDSRAVQIRRFLILAAVLLITAGILRGEPGTVLQKAVVVCMECIGLG